MQITSCLQRDEAKKKTISWKALNLIVGALKYVQLHSLLAGRISPSKLVSLKITIDQLFLVKSCAAPTAVITWELETFALFIEIIMNHFRPFCSPFILKLLDGSLSLFL